MAIRAGMSVAEAILQLTRGFRKMMGRDPDGLEKIKIQQEAVKRLEDVNKVVDMEGNVIDTSKGIMGGRQIQDSPEFGKKIRETYDKAKGPGKGQEMVDALGSPGARRSYEIMEAQLGVRLYGDETFDEILEIQKTGKHPRGEPKADGGRIGLKLGMTRRAFMKLMGAAGAGIGALKTGIIGLGKQAPEAVQTVKETVKQAPDYFFALVDKIKRFGKSVDDAVADPRIEQTYKYKNYELRENAFGEPGETIIIKTDDMGEFGYKEESMRFKKGGPTEDGVIPDEYEELTVRPDAEGKLKDVEEGIEDVSEIIEEATKTSPPIKKAAGGLAYMLGE